MSAFTSQSLLKAFASDVFPSQTLWQLGALMQNAHCIHGLLSSHTRQSETILCTELS